MARNTKKPLRWLRLDNAAKIYPAARRRNWSNVFRQSVTLVDEVDTDVLKSALDITVKRFPSIAARLRKGAFWYYLQQIASAPEIKEEYSYPLTYMSKEEMRKCAFRVIAFHNRIAIEFFHSLTDGTGALIFLKSLVAEYLEQKYAIDIPCGDGILDRKALPAEEELEDCFPKNAGTVPASRRDTNAWHMYGEAEKDGFLNLTCFRLPVKDVLEMAHQYNATLTVFISAIMMKALLNLQNEKMPNSKRRKRIKLLIPVNLRQLFPSNTLRNFAMYTIPELDPRLGEYSLEEICRVIQHKMGMEVTQKHMRCVIATNVNDERNPLVRLIPLPIKNAVMKAIFDSVGEKKSCLSLSNIGRVKVPEVMAKYIKRFDFILGVQAAAPYNCGMLSYGDTVYINFIRNIKDAELERHFFAVLQELGVSVMVESNQNER
ncbi:MAG: hypothetical protein IJZ15_05370 [Oscillospiraceae bacterium]|nr:hypothetical protein [Oscillospiraceae bacterium]